MQVWSDDTWLQKYAGKTEEIKETTSVESDKKVEGTITATEDKQEPVKQNRGNPQVYFDVKAGKLNLGKLLKFYLPNFSKYVIPPVYKQNLGRIIMLLRADVAPKTVANFQALCTHEKGFGFMGSSFHRVIPGFVRSGFKSILMQFNRNLS